MLEGIVCRVAICFVAISFHNYTRDDRDAP